MPCFDDTDGYYTFIMNQHVSYRYEVLRMLGKGSFAQVVSVIDHSSGKKYALKVNRNTEIDHKFAEQEAGLLKFLMLEDPHDEHNIVRMLEHTRFREH
jgi:dual specificity tyrosine-phosphorylation-regulated kinase 2/3/4